MYTGDLIVFKDIPIFVGRLCMHVVHDKFIEKVLDEISYFGRKNMHVVHVMHGNANDKYFWSWPPF